MIQDRHIAAAYPLLRLFQKGEYQGFPNYIRRHGAPYGRETTPLERSSFYRIFATWKKGAGLKRSRGVRLYRRSHLAGYAELDEFLQRKGLHLTAEDYFELVEKDICRGCLAFVLAPKKLTVGEASSIISFTDGNAQILPNGKLRTTLFRSRFGSYSRDEGVLFNRWQLQSFQAFVSAILQTRREDGRLKRNAFQKTNSGLNRRDYHHISQLKKINEIYIHNEN